MVLPDGGAAAGWLLFRRMHDAGRQLVAAARRRDLFCFYYLYYGLYARLATEG